MGKKTLFTRVLLLAIIIFPEPSQSLNAARILTERTNAFAFDLYQALRNDSENIVVSPISLQIVLALSLQGANGTTADEITKVLNLPEDNNIVLEGHKSLITELEVMNPLLNLATKLFVDESFDLLAEFQNVTSEYFLTDAQGINFKENPEGARIEINDWAEEKTNHTIKDLLSSDAITSDSRLILVNAIYFKANWEKQFDESLSQEMPFYITDADSLNVTMMVQPNENFQHMRSEKIDSQILILPYEGNMFNMIIILPNKIDGLTEVEEKIKNFNFTRELSGLRETTVNLHLPRFKQEETMELKDTLQKMGLNAAFGTNADFSGISNESLVISKVVQKAIIEVNEVGTVAAAATGLVAVDKSSLINIDLPVDFKCDHPFLYLVIHIPTDVVIFISRLKNF